MAGKQHSTTVMRWWSCHVWWIVPKTGTQADIFYFVQARTRVGAVAAAAEWVACLNPGLARFKTLKCRVVSAPRYYPGSKDFTWHVHRGPWAPRSG